MRLVIGYGNILRRDDAIGRLAAEAVASWRLPNVEVISMHQLVPELVESIARASEVYFLDATMTEGRWERIDPSESMASLGHTMSPGELLGLTVAMYGRSPLAWHVMIPVREWDHGDEIHPATRDHLAAVLVALRSRLG